MKLNPIFRNIFCVLCIAFSSTTQAQKLATKPFVGHKTSDEIHVWAMFQKTDSVYIQINDTSKTTHLFKKKEKFFRSYFPIQIAFNNLKENTLYQMQYSFDGIQYFPLIHTTTNNDSGIYDVHFLAGSCAFVPTGINWLAKPFTSLKIFNKMQQDSSDFMLWLGDNLYYIFNAHSYKGQLKQNIKARKKKILSAFLQSKQQYAIWDDHDYGSNNSDGNFPNKNSSLSVFKQFWPNPKNDSLNYYAFHQSDCSFFMLDDRYNNYQPASILGTRQLNWLKQELLQSKATFKFVAMGMQALNPESTKECFYKASDEYDSLISFIRKNKIIGVLILTGDRHHAELLKVENEDLYPMYDFTTSPLTMYPIKINKKNSEYENPYRVKNTYFASYNYAKIAVVGNEGNRKCRLELKNNAGKTIWSYEIPEQELK